MDATIMKMDWPLPDTFEAATTNIEAVFTEFLVAHYSAERTSLCSEVRGNIVVKSKGAKGKKPSTHIYKVRQASEIELIAVDSDKVMTEAEIDITADSIADFLIQNYLNENKLLKA